jgi:hypothetical protein
MLNESLMTNRRCKFPLAASREFRRASYARPLLSAAVAYCNRWANMKYKRSTQ